MHSLCNPPSPNVQKKSVGNPKMWFKLWGLPQAYLNIKPRKGSIEVQLAGNDN